MDLELELGRRWLDRFGGFDYGAMTVWLMRGFGLPNVRAYNTFKNSFTWGLETSEGYVLRISPGIVRIAPEEWSQAGEEREGGRFSRDDFRREMAAHQVLGVSPLHSEVPPLSDSLVESWMDQFSRPIYVRDMGATVLGPLWSSGWAQDVGPGDPSVLDAGACLADCPVPVSQGRHSGRKLHPR